MTIFPSKTREHVARLLYIYQQADQGMERATAEKRWIQERVAAANVDLANARADEILRTINVTVG
jgi:hypothetical protein